MTSHKGAQGRRRATRQRPGGAGVPMQQSLDELRTLHRGVGFIYQILNLVAAQYQLRDVVIVINGERAGIQIFRLGGRSISPDRSGLANATPGLYCDPPIVSPEDEDVVIRACREELIHIQTLRTDPTPDAKVRSQRRWQRSDRPRRRRAVAVPVGTASIGDHDDWHDDEPHPDGPFVRLVVSRLLVAVDVATLVLALANVHGTSRFVLGLVFGVFIPGWSLVGLLRMKNTPLEIGLTMAASFALILVGAQILITAHFWHLVLFEEFLCLLCLPSLVWQSRRRWIGLNASS